MNSANNNAADKSDVSVFRQIAIQHEGRTIYAPYALKDTFLRQRYVVSDVKNVRAPAKQAFPN
jgi:hypothetical protein